MLKFSITHVAEKPNGENRRLVHGHVADRCDYSIEALSSRDLKTRPNKNSTFTYNSYILHPQMFISRRPRPLYAVTCRDSCVAEAGGARCHGTPDERCALVPGAPRGGDERQASGGHGRSTRHWKHPPSALVPPACVWSTIKVVASLWEFVVDRR